MIDSIFFTAGNGKNGLRPGSHGLEVVQTGKGDTQNCLTIDLKLDYSYPHKHLS
jgi:hypothetical protein